MLLYGDMLNLGEWGRDLDLERFKQLEPSLDEESGFLRFEDFNDNLLPVELFSV